MPKNNMTQQHIYTLHKLNLNKPFICAVSILYGCVCVFSNSPVMKNLHHNQHRQVMCVFKSLWSLNLMSQLLQLNSFSWFCEAPERVTLGQVTNSAALSPLVSTLRHINSKIIIWYCRVRGLGAAIKWDTSGWWVTFSPCLSL